MSHDHDHGATTTSPGGHDMGGMMHSMSMSFHVGHEETILFETWTTETVGQFVGSCIGIFFLAALYEGLKYLREYAFLLGQKTTQDNATSLKMTLRKAMNRHHFLQTFLHMIQILLAYLLMLIFMTYNVWLCLVIILGAGCGYMVFGWIKKTTIDITEHCH